MKKRLVIIVIAFCVSFVLLAVLSLFSIGRFVTYTEYSDKVDHTNKVIRDLYKVEVSLKDLDRSERGYLLTHDTSYLRHLNAAVDSLRPAIAELDVLLKQDPEQNHNIALLKSGVALRVNYGRQNIALVDSIHTTVLSEYYYEGRKTMLEAVQRLRQMHNVQNVLLNERFANQKVYQQLTTNTLRYLLIFFCLVTLVLFIIMVREFTARIRYQQELQAKVIDLRRSHNELQEIAYAASHDLQEPLRKIQVFSNMLLYRKDTEQAEKADELITRISSSAERMQSLITDLMSLTSLTNTDEDRKPVDLDVLIQELLADMNLKVREKGATITVQQMPVITGYAHQLSILFKALLDNSLKFCREGVPPVIAMTVEKTDGADLVEINPALAERQFWKITCTDNGIGFDNKFISKMFRIFQRLHAPQSDYEGKGIGLAICQRIMVNHEGYIIANGVPNEGAKFKLYFPVVG
ncbi:MAG: CHASE3 domain-containing protein [Bacteroidota bacterium]